MKKAEEAFQALLDGHAPEGASERLLPLTKIAAALEPAERPGPSAQFKARVRSELLARASIVAVEEEEAFAALLEGQTAKAPESMRSLVKVAAALEPASLPVPSPSFRFQLRNQLLAQAARKRPLPVRVGERVVAINASMRRSLRVVGAVGMAAMLMLGSSAALAASSSSLPGDGLYGLKRFRESAQLVTVSGATEGRRLLDFAHTRLVEVRGLTRRGVTDQALYIETLNDMDEQTNQGATILIEEFRSGDAPRGTIDQLSAFGRAQAQDLEGLLFALPPGVRPVARDSIVVASQTAQRATDVLNGCPCPSNPLLEPSNSDGTAMRDPDSVGCACEQGSGSGSGNSSTGAGSDDQTGDGGSQDDDQNDGNQNDGSGNENPDGEEPGPDPNEDEPTVDIPDEVPGNEDAEDDIDDIIDELPTPSPLPTPLPSLPLPLP